MSKNNTHYTIIGLEVFTGVMAIYGGVSLLVDASGFGVKEEWLNGSPFRNYQIPALTLLVFVGGANLLAAALLWVHHEVALPLSVAVGFILMGFEVVETYSFGLRNFQQPLMFVIGLAIAALAGRMCKQNIDNRRGHLSLHVPH